MPRNRNYTSQCCMGKHPTGSPEPVGSILCKYRRQKNFARKGAQRAPWAPRAPKGPQGAPRGPVGPLGALWGPWEPGCPLIDSVNSIFGQILGSKLPNWILLAHDPKDQYCGSEMAKSQMLGSEMARPEMARSEMPGPGPPSDWCPLPVSDT